MSTRTTRLSPSKKLRLELLSASASQASFQVSSQASPMDLMLKEFIEFCRAYLNDLVAASDTFDDNVYHLTLILDVLEEHGVSLEPNKAYVAFPEVSLLGQRWMRWA
ncbi:hypothetical protein PENFLA_c027G02046 [Penicillium flavigenum]|uniref:Reverse transcriptase domain-containing protein n=1 Tax=Penicillium flavigenum TaxID=254877 RepID=A0A1V6SRP5_9EURO|nr:hypothetical protein PENFLA_c027G02046 [Penicillium flavigenum]